MFNIVTVAVLDIFHVKKYDLDFWPPRSSKIKSDGENFKPMGPTCKCSGGSTLYLSPFSRYFESKIVTLTYNLSRSSKVKPMGSLYNLHWVQHHNCCRSWHISRQKYDLYLWPLKVIQGQIWWCQSKAYGSYIQVLWKVQPHTCHRFRDISSQNFDVDLLILVELTLGPKFTKRGDDLLPT